MSSTRMNRWDSMLAWLAHQKNHKLANVKSAAQKLSILDDPGKQRTPIGHYMHWVGCLVTLGHAEFDPSRNLISASAPGLLRCSSTGRTLLYGYWGPRLKRTLRDLGVGIYVHRPRRGPSCFASKNESERMENVARELGVWYSEDTSIPLLERLPSISSVLGNLPRSQLSTEGYWESFDFISNRRWRWRPSQFPLAQPGFYRRKSGRMAFMYVAPDTRPYDVKTMDERAAAKWECAPKVDWVLDAYQRRLLIPYGTPDLPLMVSRGLTMTSARMPFVVSFDDMHWWSYVSVGEDQAVQAARIMEQEVELRSLVDV